MGFFSGQHAAQILRNGNLLLYDNGLRHSSSETRVVEYALDVPNRVATMVWQFRHSPPIYTPYVGFVERLAGGNTFIGWGLAATMTEATPGGTVAWEGTLQTGAPQPWFYRARKIPSLYEYREP